MEPGAFATAGGDVARSACLGFLCTGPLAAKTPVRGRWIVIDFLGFFRADRDFWVTQPEARKIFRSAFSVASDAPEPERAVEAMRKGGIIHKASAILPPLFRNRLSSEPFRFAATVTT